VYHSLQRRFGGGPLLKQVKVCEKTKAHVDAYNVRKQAELQLVEQYDTKDTGTGQYWYLVDADEVEPYRGSTRF
jgi:hypothetical protein